jgi:hypothetical protein
MARTSKLAKQQDRLDSLRTTTLYNKVMVDALFSVLEEKHILTREEVENRASEILHKACPDFRWLQ